MKKSLLLASASLCLVPVAFAQQPAGALAKTQRIAVISMEQIYAESALGKEYAVMIDKLEGEIKSLGTKKQGDLQRLEADLQKLQDEFEKQQSVLSEEAADKKQQEMVAKRREAQAFREDAQREMERMQGSAQRRAQVLTNEFQIKVKPFIEQVTKDKNVDVLLDSRFALFAAPSLDLTREVITLCDADSRAKQGSKPAATASPSPAR
jgi:Skp family chaperone for outer membrane proteins